MYSSLDELGQNIKRINVDFKDDYFWAKSNKFKINLKKSNFMIIGSTWNINCLNLDTTVQLK